MPSYIARVKALARHLTSAGEQVSTTNLINKIIGGLDSSYVLIIMNMYLGSIHIPEGTADEVKQKYKVVILHRHLTGRAHGVWQESYVSWDQYVLSLATRFVDGINDRVVQIQVDDQFGGVHTPFFNVIRAYLGCTMTLRRQEAATTKRSLRSDTPT